MLSLLIAFPPPAFYTQASAVVSAQTNASHFGWSACRGTHPSRTKRGHRHKARGMASFPAGTDPARPGVVEASGDISASPLGLRAPPGLPTAGQDSSELQKEIKATIEAQVSRLLEQARVDTESKVKAELKQIHVAMAAMSDRLDQLLAHLDGVHPPEQTEAALSAEEVGHFLAKTEQQWGQEIRTLKQELHQTILAHNHNADLIKHHKETIDSLRERSLKMSGRSTKTADIQAQLQRLNERLKQQEKHRKLEPLFERISVLEMRLAAAAQGTSWGGYPSMPMQGLPTGMSQGPPGLSSLAAHAMAPGLKAPGSKTAGEVKDKAPVKNPTDEDVAARIGKLSLGGQCAAPAGETSAQASQPSGDAATGEAGA
eukprot:TRINITY_DN8520_c0_g1_i2.p1 TRINITY_DN8520_c0_g1~~TRINITY_DN8520_c0_g1_i2.p1  ORF type:complete len:372 (+),score=69.54 TRINITY_DN8520_c0_g1_i2:3-1118(+)